MSSHQTIGEAWLALRADGARFAADVSSTADKNLKEVAKRGAEIIGGMFIGAKFTQAAKAGLDELKEAQGQLAITEAHIKSTGGAANVTAEEVLGLSGSLSAMSGVDDEVIQGGENMLLTFKRVRNEVGAGSDIFNRATADALDLSKSGFGSVESASVLLGKALDNPIKGVTALQRVGVALTDQQKQQIKAFVESGDVLSAQKVILAEVESQVGGTAAAYGDTLPGKLDIAQQSLKNTEASLVSGAAPALELFASWVAAASEAVGHLPAPLQTAIAIVGTAGVAFVSIAKPIGAVIELYDRFFGAAKAAAAAQELETAATTSKAGATLAAEAAESKAILSSLGLAGANAVVATTAEGAAAAEAELAGASALSAGAMLGIAAAAIAVGAALYYGVTHAEDFSLSLKGVSDVQLDVMLDKIVAGAELTGRSMYDVGKSLPIDEAIRLADSLDRNGKSSAEVRRAVADMTQAEKDSREAHKQAEDAINNQTRSIDAQVPSLEELRSGTFDLTDAEKELVAAADAAAAAHDGFSGFVDSLAGAMDKSYQSLLAGAEATGSYEKASNALVDSLAKNGTSLDVVIDKTGKYSEKALANQDAVRGVGESIAKLIELRFQETHSVDDAVAAGENYVQNLREQLEAAGYNTDRIDEMIRVMHLTPEDIKTTFTNNAIEQQIVIGKYITQLKDIPSEVRSKIEAEIQAGQFDLANQQLDYLARGRTVYFNPEVIPKDFSVTSPNGGRTIMVRAGGGPVYAGQMYEVNEDGSGRREFFAPAVDGSILSADRLESALRSAPFLSGRGGASATAVGGAPGGMPIYVTVEFHGALPTTQEATQVGHAAGAGIAAQLARSDVALAARMNGSDG